MENGKRIIKPTRYQYLLARKPAIYVVKYSGTTLFEAMLTAKIAQMS